MHCRYPIHAWDHRHSGTAPEFCDREIRALWRELARPVTLFDLCSSRNFLAGEMGGFFREKRARQDSNLRPPA